MDRLVVVKFHSNIANRWLFMIQRKIMAIILYSYLDMFRGPFFPDTVYKLILIASVSISSLFSITFFLFHSLYCVYVCECIYAFLHDVIVN